MTVRRASDIVLSLVLLLVCLPTIALTAFAVWLDQRTFPLCREERLTRSGQVVSVFRLRTARATHFGARRTPLGEFLQRWHLDEIPQLFNVLTGELSLVGEAGLIEALDRKKVLALRDP